MTWLLSSVFWALLTLAKLGVGLVFQIFVYALWLFWPFVMALGLLVVSAQSAEAGWMSWLWGSNTRELERSLDVAQEAARVASQAAESQAQQAVAQAQQNARLAETLGQLSSERSNFADYLQALSELGLKDSQLAAALTAFGPVLVCVAVLLVAGLALWLANRPGEGQPNSDLAETVDLLVEELAAHSPEPTGLYEQVARTGSLRLDEHRKKHAVALVGYAGEDPDDSEDSKHDGEPMPF
jgi:ABC-type multidrug transport system fused ATPase/permease subunit